MTSIKILNTNLVKPSIPTPPHLKHYKLSFIDEILPLMEVGVLLFYASNPKTINLKQSLAQVLSSFYPLAGRFIIKDHIVDCSDQGAELLEAQAPDSDLLTLLSETNIENLNGFLPRKNHHQQEVATYPILSIQITDLNCGGLVIGISISHKIFDVAAMSTFIAAWSSASNPDLERERVPVRPAFNASSLFPSKNPNRNPNATIRSLDMKRVAVKRFSFNKEAIASLRSSIGPKEGKQGVLSRVRAVCAVIATSLIRVDKGKFGRSRDCLMTQAVNMRERTIPPLHKHACGNLVILSLAYRNTTETDELNEVEQVADLLGEATSKSIADCSTILSLDEEERNNMLMDPLRTTGTTFLSGEANVVTFTDYSKFGFYEMDFGWGKPVWAGIAPHTIANTVVVMGNRDGDGIEAWVHLDKDDMRLFEEDEEIIRLCQTQSN